MSGVGKRPNGTLKVNDVVYRPVGSEIEMEMNWIRPREFSRNLSRIEIDRLIFI